MKYQIAVQVYAPCGPRTYTSGPLELTEEGLEKTERLLRDAAEKGTRLEMISIDKKRLFFPGGILQQSVLSIEPLKDE